MGPLILQESNQDCYLEPEDSSAPEFFFRDGAAALWTCQIPESKPFLWNFQGLPPNLTGTQIVNLGSEPEPLQYAEFETGKWGGYTVTSKEGERDHWGVNEWMDKAGNWNMYSSQAWREGLQSPAFWNQPLTFMNITNRYGNTTEPPSYKFGLLHEKKVLFREKTLEAKSEEDVEAATTLEDNDVITEGEVVWMCSWNKTIFEVDLFLDEDTMEEDTVGYDLPAFISSYSDVTFDGKEELYASEEVLEEMIEDDINSGMVENIDDLFDSESNIEDQVEAIYDTPQDPLEDSVFDAMENNQNFGGEPQHPVTPVAVPTSTPTPVQDPSSLSGMQKKRAPGRYPLKLEIREYRPNTRRLKDVQGIDRTEGDTDPRTKWGAVHCVKMMAIANHGLRTFVGKDGEGKVTLRQRETEARKACFCRWTN